MKINIEYSSEIEPPITRGDLIDHPSIYKGWWRNETYPYTLYRVVEKGMITIGSCSRQYGLPNLTIAEHSKHDSDIVTEIDHSKVDILIKINK